MKLSPKAIKVITNLLNDYCVDLKAEALTEREPEAVAEINSLVLEIDTFLKKVVAP